MGEGGLREEAQLDEGPGMIIVFHQILQRSKQTLRIDMIIVVTIDTQDVKPHLVTTCQYLTTLVNTSKIYCQTRSFIFFYVST